MRLLMMMALINFFLKTQKRPFMTRKRKKKLKINFGQWRNCHFRHQPAHGDVVGSAINGDLQRKEGYYGNNFESRGIAGTKIGLLGKKSPTDTCEHPNHQHRLFTPPTATTTRESSVSVIYEVG
jgi:hypothetical protein